MAESFVQVAVDSTGKMLRTETSVQGGNTVHAEVMVVQDVNGNLIGSSTVPGVGLQAALAAMDGTSFARQSAAVAASQIGTNAQQVALPGNWSVVSFPATNTAAVAVKAAGGAGVRHVCTAVSFGLGQPATALAFLGNLQILDGVTIIWQKAISSGAGTAVNGQSIDISGLALVGSANASMTAQFSAAAGAATQESVTLMGYDLS